MATFLWGLYNKQLEKTVCVLRSNDFFTIVDYMKEAKVAAAKQRQTSLTGLSCPRVPGGGCCEVTHWLGHSYPSILLMLN